MTHRTDPVYGMQTGQGMPHAPLARTKPVEPTDGRESASADPERFRRLVERIAGWTDGELASVNARQTRYIAQVVIEGADPKYPPFAATNDERTNDEGSLDCPACLGSGHVEDARDAAAVIRTIEHAVVSGALKGMTAAAMAALAEPAKVDAAEAAYAGEDTAVAHGQPFREPDYSAPPFVLHRQAAGQVAEALDPVVGPTDPIPLWWHKPRYAARPHLDPTPEAQRAGFEAVVAQGRPTTVEVKEAIEALESWGRALGRSDVWQAGQLRVAGDLARDDMPRLAAIMDRLGCALIAQDAEVAELNKALDFVAKGAVPLDDTGIAELVQAGRVIVERNPDAQPGSASEVIGRLCVALLAEARRSQATRVELAAAITDRDKADAARGQAERDHREAIKRERLDVIQAEAKSDRLGAIALFLGRRQAMHWQDREQPSTLRIEFLSAEGALDAARAIIEAEDPGEVPF